MRIAAGARSLIIAAALVIPPAAVSTPLNDTGQIACFDDTANSTGTVSPGTPDPEPAGFDGQDCTAGAAAVDAAGAQVKVGGSSVKGRDYSKIGNNGSVLANSAPRGTGPTGWGCTRDNITGLVWGLSVTGGRRYSWGSTVNAEGNTCGGSFPACNTDSVIAAANTSNACGHNDWRLPTPTELEGLLAYDNDAGTNTWIDRTWFPDETSDGVNPFQFWSNTTSPDDNTSAWTASFEYAQISGADKGSAAYVRLVRGASASNAVGPFTTTQPVAGQYVTTDARTGLMWKTCPEGQSGSACTAGTQSSLTWSGALTAAANSTYAGHGDWRLPTSMELSSLRDYGQNYTGSFGLDTGLDPAAFPNAGATAFWSSTNTPRGSSLMTAVTYSYLAFSSHADGFKTSTAAVRLVRAGDYLLAAHSVGDFTPDPFTLIDITAPAGTLATSNTITVSGLASPTDIASLAVTGAAESAYSINGAPFTPLAGAVRDGDTVAVQHRTASGGGQIASTTLSIGGVTETFVTTTPTGVTNVSISASQTMANTAATITVTFTPGTALAAGDTISARLSGYTFTAGAIAITPVSGISGNLAGSVSAGATDTVVATLAAGASAAAGTPATFTFPATNPAAQTIPAAGLTVATSRDTTPVASSSGITITPQLKLAFTVQPGGATAGVVFTTQPRVAIQLLDGSATNATDIIHLAKQSGPGTLTCTDRAAVAGVATFTDCRIDAAGSYVIAATSLTRPAIVGASSLSFQVIAVPGAPTIGTATAGNAQATVSFTPPASNGGSPITAYTATSTPGNIASIGCVSSPCTVTGLSNGTSYTFTVKATNAAGTGPASAASNSVTPTVPLLPPTIAFVGTPRTRFPMNHRSNFVNFFIADQVLQVGDPDGSIGALTVTVTSSNPGLVPVAAPLFPYKAPPYSNDVNKVAGFIKPAKDQYGTTTLTYTVQDSDGQTASISTVITIDEGNIRPSATYVDAIRLPAGAPSGTYTVPNLVRSQTPGDGEESAQSMEHAYAAMASGGWVFAPTSAGTFAGPSLDFDYNSTIQLIVAPVDDYGGFPANPTVCLEHGNERGNCGNVKGYVRVTAGDEAGVGVTVARAEPVAPHPVPPSMDAASDTTPMTYRIRVVNNGSVPLQGVHITVAQPSVLQNASWTCTAPGPGCVPAAGTGAVSTLVDLDLDEEAIVLFSGEIGTDVSYVLVKADAELPPGVPAAAFPVLGLPVLLDVVSDEAIFYDDFESYLTP